MTIKSIKKNKQNVFLMIENANLMVENVIKIKVEQQ